MNVQRTRRPHRIDLLWMSLVLAAAIGRMGPSAASAADSDGLERAPRASSMLNMSRFLGGGAGPDDETPTTETDTVVGPIMALESDTPLPSREMDEQDSPLELMPDVVSRIIYGSRNFQYDAKGQPDPMIVPWVRVEVLSQEHLAQARAYLSEAEDLTSPAARQKRYLAAVTECDEVLKINEDSKYGKDALALKTKALELLEALRQPIGPGPVKIAASAPKPPQWVIINTKAVIFDQTGRGEHIVLVGDSLLSVGSVVPKYENVKVLEITQTSVTYEFKHDPEKDAVPFTVTVTEETDNTN